MDSGDNNLRPSTFKPATFPLLSTSNTPSLTHTPPKADEPSPAPILHITFPPSSTVTSPHPNYHTVPPRPTPPSPAPPRPSKGMNPRPCLTLTHPVFANCFFSTHLYPSEDVTRVR
ncbi:hypothetical protein E2C01_089114 [Portunus trituberculatus]|uniref:Uncharacterized protein n=1 Tax=Portunus trituberculatus TaxID=210409 RepID=A0A5B7JI82_PORTR|nr:hypothetical protein [Portunus trituberculatus]